MKKLNNGKLNNDGFTLVEVLVAMAILAIVSIPILSIFASAAKTNAQARRIEDANTVVNDIIEEAKATSLKELKESDGTSYKYSETKTLIDGTSYADSAYSEFSAFNVSTTDNSEGYFIGAGDEKFKVQITFNPTYYTDSGLSNVNINNSNNINSSGVSIYNDLSDSGCFIYRDDSADDDAVNYFKGIVSASSFREEYIHKVTTVNVDLARTNVSTATTAPVIVQVLTITSVYTYKDETTSPATVLADTYSRETVYELNRFTAEAVMNADGSAVDHYIVSSDSDHKDNLNKVYIFYTPFNKKADRHITGETNQVYCDDQIYINYNYDTSADVTKIYYDQCEVYLLEQAEYVGVNRLRLNIDNIYLANNYYSSIKYNSGTNKLTFNGTTRDSATPSSWSKRKNKGVSELSDDLLGTGTTNYKTYLYSNARGWTTSSTKVNEDYLMYRMTIKVYYKDSLIAESDTAKLE